MEPIDYQIFLTAAREMIDAAGTPCSVVVKVDGATKGNSWDHATAETRTIPFRGAFFNAKQKFIAGSMVVEGEQKLISAPTNPPLTREMAMGAIVNRGNEVWRVTGFDITKPGGTALLYTFKVKL